MAKVNRPRVRMFIGKVKTSNTGLITRFAKLSTKAVIMADI